MALDLSAALEAAERKHAELVAENERLKRYWLCPDGLTFAQFMLGAACPSCGMGAEHREARAALKERP